MDGGNGGTTTPLGEPLLAKKARAYRPRCPGCRIDRLNAEREGVFPLKDLFLIWLVTITCSKQLAPSLPPLFLLLLCYCCYSLRSTLFVVLVVFAPVEHCAWHFPAIFFLRLQTTPVTGEHFLLPAAGLHLMECLLWFWVGVYIYLLYIYTFALLRASRLLDDMHACCSIQDLRRHGWR